MAICFYAECNYNIIKHKPMSCYLGEAQCRLRKESRPYFNLFFCSILLLTSLLYATTVPMDKALQAGLTHYNRQQAVKAAGESQDVIRLFSFDSLPKFRELDVREVITISDNEQPVYFIFNLTPEAWIWNVDDWGGNIDRDPQFDPDNPPRDCQPIRPASTPA